MENEDPKMAQARILEVLQSWPLYRKFRYTANLKGERIGGQAGQQVFYYLLLPQELRLYCSHPKCKNDQRWEIAGENRIWEHEGEPLTHKTYGCRNCGESVVDFFIYWIEKDGVGEFFKVGQYPSVEVQPASDLRLSSEDLGLYRKALTCYSVSFGNGALAYLRRVVENKMNSLLDLVYEAARTSGTSEDDLASLIQVRQTGFFEEKARIAAKYMPANFRPGGSNPFDILADFASKGMHWESEEQCLEIFERIRKVFEYLFRNLSFTTTEAKEYVETLTKLSGSKS
jgi:hypothetical protein